MNKMNTLNIRLALNIIIILFVWAGCREVNPPAAIIEKAKIETRSILDSLDQNSSTIISDIELLSQHFDGDLGKYLINYEIESGLDSAHITSSKATIFLEQKNDKWFYRFVFGDTYERNLQ